MHFCADCRGILDVIGIQLYRFEYILIVFSPCLYHKKQDSSGIFVIFTLFWADAKNQLFFSISVGVFFFALFFLQILLKSVARIGLCRCTLMGKNTIRF